MKTLLVDADIVAYKFSAAAEQSIQWEEGGEKSLVVDELTNVQQEVDSYLDWLREYLSADNLIICLSCPSSENWRLKVLDSYKANRKDMVKPTHLSAIRKHLEEKYATYQRPTLEADDVMGILSTWSGIDDTKIIVSEDKDMKTIPGLLFNPRKDQEPRVITEEEANYWHLYQTLVGDPTDNYKGCPGVGPKKAEKILASECNFEAVVLAFQSKGLTEEDALVQARVARICRASDWDFKKREVILWNP